VVALFGHHSIGNSGFEPHYIATTHTYTGYSRILFGYHQRIFYNHINIKTKNKNKDIMKPLVSIIMGSTSDLPIMEKACKWLEQYEIPFEVNALSAHRTPAAVEKFAKEAKERGIKVIIAGAGMAAALPGVIAASTSLPVIGVPIKGMLDGLDAMLSIIQMPPGIPVATVGVNGAQNAAILAAEMMALGDEEIAKKVEQWKATLGQKIEKANQELAEIKDYKFKC